MKTKILTPRNTTKKIYLLPFTILIVFLFSSLEMKCNYDVIWTDTTNGGYDFTQAKFSPDGQYIAVSQKNHLYDTSKKGRVFIINSSNGQIVKTLYHNTTTVNSVVFLNDSIIASADTYESSDTNKRTSIRIWNINTGQNINTLMANDTAFYKFWMVDYLDCTPDGAYLFANLWTTEKWIDNTGFPHSYPPQIYVWNTQTWQLNRKIDNYLSKISPDGTYYVTYNGQYDICYLWDIQQDTLLQKIQLHPYGGFKKLNISPNGRFIAFLDNVDSTKIYDKIDRSIIRNWSFKPSFPNKNISNSNLAFSSNSNYVIITGGDYDSLFVITRRLDSNIIKSNLIYGTNNFEVGDLCLEIPTNDTHILIVSSDIIQFREIDWATSGVNLGSDTPQTALEIFPNPATDFLEISVGVRHAEPLQTIEIFSVLGEKLKQIENGELKIENDKIRIDVSALSTGLYFIRVGAKVGKFVKI